MRNFLIALLLVGMVVGLMYFVRQPFIMVDKEIVAFHKFQDDPHNIGQYICDFDTGIWYDIDSSNPNVLALTINEMKIKNIRDRIMKYEPPH